MGASSSACPQPSQPALYKPRRPSKTPFHKLVSRHFVEFEHIYPSRYQSEFGFWRPVIRDVVEEYIKCGELIHWHPHIHMIATDGAFRPDGTFLPMPKTSAESFLKIWEHEIFRLLLKEKLITEEVVTQMRTWKHSGFHTRVFSVHRDVFLPAGDKRGIENLAQYIARCPFSMARMVQCAEMAHWTGAAQGCAIAPRLPQPARMRAEEGNTTRDGGALRLEIVPALEVDPVVRQAHHERLPPIIPSLSRDKPRAVSNVLFAPEPLFG